MRLASGTPAVAATQFDWTAAFAQERARRARAAGEPATSSMTPARNLAPQSAVSQTASTAPRKLAMTPQTWALINRTNATVNRAIVPQTDLATYGVAEVWATPLENGVKYGDCEDYVLEKRRALLGSGLPPAALSIAVVATFRGETHAVLLVDTDAGEYVLDSLTPWVLPWTKASYRWRERQVAGSASHWAMAADAAPADQRRPDLLLASLP